MHQVHGPEKEVSQQHKTQKSEPTSRQDVGKDIWKLDSPKVMVTKIVQSGNRNQAEGFHGTPPDLKKKISKKLKNAL